MNNTRPEPRVNKLGHVVTKHVTAGPPASASTGAIPAPAVKAPRSDSKSGADDAEFADLGKMLASAKKDETVYYRQYLDKGDIDGIRILHASRLEAASVVEIMDALDDIGVLDKNSTMDERMIKVQLHTPFHEAGLIDYSAYGEDDEKNERLMRLVEDYAGHSVRVLEMMMAGDVQYAEELRPALIEMDRNAPPVKERPAVSPIYPVFG